MRDTFTNRNNYNPQHKAYEQKLNGNGGCCFGDDLPELRARRLLLDLDIQVALEPFHHQLPDGLGKRVQLRICVAPVKAGVRWLNWGISRSGILNARCLWSCSSLRRSLWMRESLTHRGEASPSRPTLLSCPCHCAPGIPSCLGH